MQKHNKSTILCISKKRQGKCLSGHYGYPIVWTEIRLSHSFSSVFDIEQLTPNSRRKLAMMLMIKTFTMIDLPDFWQGHYLMAFKVWVKVKRYYIHGTRSLSRNIYIKYEKDSCNGRTLTARTRFICPIWQSHDQMALKTWIKSKSLYTHQAFP